MTTALVEAASGYLSAGLEIIALTGKKPNTIFHPHGLTDCMSGVPEGPDDDALIERVFTHEKTTGIGVLIPPFMMVADVDSNEAAQQLLDLAGDVPETAVSKTRNGLHVWYVCSKTRGSAWMGKLLLRGRGSYVVAPPSEHPDGGTYSWIGESIVDPDSGSLRGLDFLPDPIEAFLQIEDQRAAEKPEREDAYSTEIVFNPLEPGKFWLQRRLDPSWSTGLSKAIISAQDGNQNNVIAWAAMVARDEGVPIEIALPELLAASIEGGHPESRARETIKAAYRRPRRG